MEDLVKIVIPNEEKFDIGKTYVLVEEEKYQRLLAFATEKGLKL